MNEQRLEVLKLVHRHDLTPEQLIERADKLVDWLNKQAPQVPQAPKGRKATTINPLD